MLRFVVPISLLVAAFAAAPADAGKLAFSHSAARLRACDPPQRTATFRGRMLAWGKASTLEMRFALLTRGQNETEWMHGAPPEGFDTWLPANPGVKRYVVDKTVIELAEGLSYRAVVKFRWRNEQGEVVARSVRRTKPCAVPDHRPNLVLKHIGQRAGSSDSTRTYLVRVENSGETEAGPFSVGLQVNGQQLAQQATTEAFVEGDWNVFEFEGPPCEAGQAAIATVDTGGSVDESDEADNTLTVPCPLPQRART